MHKSFSQVVQIDVLCTFTHAPHHASLPSYAAVRRGREAAPDCVFQAVFATSLGAFQTTVNEHRTTYK